MKMDYLFDLMVHRRENEDPCDFTTPDGAVTLSPKQQKKYIKKQVQAFMHTHGQNIDAGETEKVIQAFTGSADLPVLTKDVFNVTNEVPNYDLGWQPAFKGVQLRKGQLDWEIATTSSSSTFEEIAEGGKIKYGKFEGEKVIAGIAKYGMGIGITWETIEGRKLYMFLETMNDTRSKLYKLWADVHYGLLAAAAAANTSAKAQAEGFAADALVIAWQGVATDATIDRDVLTINKGYETLGNITKDRGYGDTANVEMLVYASPLLKARLQQVFKTVNPDQVRKSGPGVAAGQAMLYNVTPIYSWNSALPANKAVMVIPKNKIQNSVYLQELGLKKQDQDSLNELQAYWSAFGAVVADNDQCAQLSFT